MIQHLCSSSSLLVNGTVSSVTVVTIDSPSSSNPIAALTGSPSSIAANAGAVNTTGAAPPGTTGAGTTGVGSGVMLRILAAGKCTSIKYLVLLIVCCKQGVICPCDSGLNIIAHVPSFSQKRTFFIN